MRLMMISSFVIVLWPGQSNSIGIGDSCSCSSNLTGIYEEVTPGSGNLYCCCTQGE